MIHFNFRKRWIRFWMHYGGLHPFGRLATCFAACLAPPYKARSYLAKLNDDGYVAPSASIHHSQLQMGRNVFIGDRVDLYQGEQGGAVTIGDRTHIHRDTIIETGQGGCLTIGADTHIQPRCQFSAYFGSIKIGSAVQIAPNCSFYPYNHGVDAAESIQHQPLQTKGGICIEDEAWLGIGVTVLDGVNIGKGSVIGAGSVVTKSVPDGVVASGVPAKVVKSRADSTSPEK